MPDPVEQMLNRAIFPEGDGKCNPKNFFVSRRIELSAKHFRKCLVP